MLESKGVDSKINLRSDENAKITNAESLFKGINITFEKQFNNDKLETIIKNIINKK
ncbi:MULTISPECIES: hypothetical protein [unclassified Campylobacter]|uniref:hypothetical protein n=1 Tax=unclassified Campylobacter TaxID=2593542 RepID=UPI001BD9DD8E|nr:hypothetical protein [Campylobacter sp. 2018MI01]MBT0881644.1 hypothetical protein [Campylobacter sp. 2018MI27]MBT0885095.1 hypothetical protein [Campylobacter sp. 2018MI10]MBZ7976570.1 hypothetical protein [Campylobacter sp. RM12637]MBZ7992236.1 hypothetical protein [Campylobacter sp. RM9333]